MRFANTAVQKDREKQIKSFEALVADLKAENEVLRQQAVDAKKAPEPISPKAAAVPVGALNSTPP